jgi:hypothetical protein
MILPKSAAAASLLTYIRFEQPHDPMYYENPPYFIGAYSPWTPTVDPRRLIAVAKHLDLPLSALRNAI